LRHRRWRVFLGMVFLAVGAARCEAAGVFDVSSFGAVPDDGLSDQQAIRDALAAAKRAGGGTVRFPAGTFESGLIDNENLRGVVIEGAGAERTVVRSTDADRYIFRFLGAEGLTIRNIAFDANGALQYGGIVFKSCKRVVIENTRYFDGDTRARSAVPTAQRTDIYSYVFAPSGAPHEDITVRNNRIDDLQLEVDDTWGAVITSNTITRPARTAGIGLFSLQEKPASGRNICGRDITIQYNTIQDLRNAFTGIAVHLDPAHHLDGSPLNNIEYRNIRILDNLIRITTAGGRNKHAISVGQTDNSRQTQGVVFDGISVQRNAIVLAPGADILGGHFIQLMTSRPFTGGPDFFFTNTVVRDNTLYGKSAKDVVRIWGGDASLIDQNNGATTSKAPAQPRRIRLEKG